MRQIEPRQLNSAISLLVGAIAGLIVGLLIGWVFWPVEWQGATLDELFPAQKAEYLGAVADAFAISRTPEAAEVAQQRVSALGADLSNEMAAAIAYFSGSSDLNREIRIGNLSLLASTLGISTPGLVGVTQSNQPASAPASDAVAPTSDATPVAEPTSGWLTWLLYVLLGLLLLLAGLYLLLRIRQQSQGNSQMGEHIDQQISSLGNGSADPWERRTHSYVAAEDDPSDALTAQSEDTWQQPATVSPVPADEYSFDDEPEEPSHVRPATANWVGANRGSHVAQLRLDEELDAPEDDELDEEELPDNQPAYPPLLPGAADLNRPPQRTSLERPPQAEMPTPTIYGRPEGRTSQLTARPETAFALPSTASAERPTTLARPAAKHKLLEIYTAQYQVGLHDYDESHPIMDPAAGKYVGECGMGASTKNSLLQNNPDHVIALEIWLFDKTDEKNVGTQTRVLLSEYAIDHNLVQAFLKERQDDPRPFTAQPNIRFQLESPNLLLDCTIIEAIYAASGPTKGVFQSVKVEMVVHKKG